ncbi:PAS domain-containing protein [Cellulomonas massiliensis]|uniref:PAS domain-containing protein n=1 Tax=Cellulomonas massiliensis TaxID=1465811 RepID=UPI0002E2E38A|nr:PAS domain-containing protein [Cellulomonas massiliensis]
MRPADVALRGITSSTAFRASAAPYLVLGGELRICAANVAYERATHHRSSDMLREFMFDVFPDNPATPEARSVERLAASFERALRRGEPDRMALQRYDVPAASYGFVQKSWLPVNSPIRDADGRTIGILHHVEDVTRMVATTGLELDLATRRLGPRGTPVGGGLVDARRAPRPGPAALPRR